MEWLLHYGKCKPFSATRHISAIKVTPDDISPDSICLSGRNCQIKKAWETGRSGAFELKPGNAYFALAIEGNSMIEEGIEDGDYVIFKHQAVVKQGEIAVVRIDGPWESGSTVKKYYKHDTTIRLKAANPQYQPQELIFKDGDPTIAILGKAVVVVSFRPSGTGS